MIPDDVKQANAATIQRQTQQIAEQQSPMTMPKVSCGNCDKPVSTFMAFKCYHCAIYYCRACGADHFGPDHTYD